MINKYPRVVIAGIKSGVGKTTVTMGLMHALNKRSKVQPYKVGPDYIDPAYHSRITGRKSRNLDGWLLNEDTLRYLFCKNMEGADCAVIEGVMGLFDGAGSGFTGSTAQVAKALRAPVILVVDGSGMGASAAALVNGYCRFDQELSIAGVIFNRISGEKHYRLLREAVEKYAGVPVLGYLPKEAELELPSRHLGLVPSVEIPGLWEKIEKITCRLEQTVAIDEILRLAGEWEQPLTPETIRVEPVSPARSIPIGIAYDEAFNFYYWDNLDLLEELGAELVYFSPLHDREIPSGLAGLILGGGFPEVFAPILAENISMKRSITEALAQGLPYYAECGGLMYLLKDLVDFEGKCFPMAGWLPGRSRMTSRLQKFGYARLELLADCIWGRQGSAIRVHNFHHSLLEEAPEPTAYELIREHNGAEKDRWRCGYLKGKGAAGYPHLHFYSNPDFARHFLQAALAYQNKNYSGVMNQ